MILGSGLLQSTGPSFGTVAADSSDSALLAGQDALVCVYDGAAYIYFGKASGTWKTLWADTTGALLRGDEAGTYAVTLASDGPAPFDVAYAFATDRKAGPVAAETTFGHTANVVLRFTVDALPSASTSLILFRIQDSSNYWRVLWYPSGNLSMTETISGGINTRAALGSTVSVGAAGTIIADDETISVAFNTSVAFSYSSAANFKTATDGKVLLFDTGAISNLVAWPRYALTVSAILNKVSA